ncbi:uncharacterized protein LOC103317809 isoform X2 [Nasonia vitripennis]|uniref:Uncharacterized protein n=1 Tax=Nasonia vitripennis TaxID=7425 RepID=A0A7M7HBY3_NASVI|nr:uncharacterized protein LOC103317809 isoform X2 [Nasonia vitripennis]
MKRSSQAEGSSNPAKFNERQPDSLRYLDSGDGVGANPPHTRRFVDNRQPECLEAGECAAYHSHRPAAYQSGGGPSLHAETQRSSQVSSNSSRALQFTPEMIRDQELLVTSMSQQGIPETLIRRQFERLMDEQSKQLRLLGDNSKSAEANAPRVRRNSSTEDTRRDNETPPRTSRLEPSSLLKIRMRKEETDFRKRNNGLQDPVVARDILKKCSFKVKGAVRRNENSATQGQIVRLNGAQDRSEMESLELQPTRSAEVREKQKSANGLENARNSQRVDEQHTRQHYCEQSAPLSQNDQAAIINATNEQQQQQYATQSSFNNLTYWPEFQEPRVIGGLTYFARKPQCIPSPPGLLCDNNGSVDPNKAART